MDLFALYVAVASQTQLGGATGGSITPGGVGDGGSSIPGGPHLLLLLLFLDALVDPLPFLELPLPFLELPLPFLELPLPFLELKKQRRAE